MAVRAPPQQVAGAIAARRADMGIHGEVSLLGGLTSDSDTQSIAGIPGVANMPVLGYLFGTRSKDKEKDDILVALIPRIIRAPAAINPSDEGVLAGTERLVRVRRQEAPPAAPPQPAQPQPAPPAQGVQPPQAVPPRRP